MTASICDLCSAFFEARYSYGLCPMCWTRDRLREYDRVASTSYHAKRAGLPVTLTLKEWLSTTADFKGRCAFCLAVPFSRIEMMDPHAGLTYANVVPACKSCTVHHEYAFDRAVQRVQSYLASDRTPTIEEEVSPDE